MTASTAAGRIMEAQALREEGNNLLKAGSLREAARVFKRAFAYTRGLHPKGSNMAIYALAVGQHGILMDIEERTTVRRIEAACNTALAVIYLNMGTPLRALAYGRQVLDLEPVNVQGLFRTGQAYLRLGNIEPAKRFLTRAAKLEPNNVAIRSELRYLSKVAQERHAIGIDAHDGRTSTFTNCNIELANVLCLSGLENGHLGGGDSGSGSSAHGLNNGLPGS